MLERTLDVDLAPGSNPRGDYSASNWVFLLPHLDLGRVDCVGDVPANAVAVLEGLASEVHHHQDLSGVPAAASDLVAVGKAQADLAAAVAALRPGAALWAADGAGLAGQPGAPPAGRRYALALAAGGVSDVAAEGRRSLLLLPDPDPPPGWVTEQARRLRRVATRLTRRVGLSRPATQDAAEPFASHLGGALAPVPVDTAPPGHTGLLLPDGTALGWVRGLARGAGVRLDGWGWRLTRRADYATQKLLVFFSPPEGDGPQVLVKITRLARHNHRLENEVDALRRLAEVPAATAAVPTILFAGRPGGVAVAGQTVIEGAPFRQVTTATPDCPHAHGMVAWLTDLAAATRDPGGLDPGRAAARLGALVSRFAALYGPEPPLRAFLEAHVARIAEGPPLPAVFVHGDPGNWNLLVTDDGRLGVLDWENAEPAGVPLWDLYYFLQTFGVWVATVAGRRYTPRTYRHQLLDDGSLSRLLVDSAAAYCARAGVPAVHAEALLHLCWVQYAVREAMRLPPQRLHASRYLRLLRANLAHLDSAGLTGLRRLAGGS